MEELQQAAGMCTCLTQTLPLMTLAVWQTLMQCCPYPVSTHDTTLATQYGNQVRIIGPIVRQGVLSKQGHLGDFLFLKTSSSQVSILLAVELIWNLCEVLFIEAAPGKLRAPGQAAHR